MRPQQTGGDRARLPQPACSSTSTAALPTCGGTGCEVSGEGVDALAAPARGHRLAYHRCSVSPANSGISPCARPPSSVAARCSPGAGVACSPRAPAAAWHGALVQWQPAEREVGPRSPPLAAFPMVGEELGLVGRDVDVGGAIALTPLAGQAEIESLSYLVGAPAIIDRGVTVAVEHLEQQSGPAAREVLLLLRHLIRRAIRVRLCGRGGGIARPTHRVAAARTTGGRRVAEEQVLRRGRFPSLRGWCSSSLAGWTTLPGFILSPGSKTSFSSANARTICRPNMIGSSSPRTLAVAMLARERSAVGGDGPRCRALHETAVPRDTVGAHKARTGCGCARNLVRSAHTGSASASSA